MLVPIWQLGLALVAGAALGVFYFGGLWLTVRRAPTSRWPHALALASFFGRTVVAVAAIVVAASIHWQLLVACVAALVVTRMVLLRAWGPDRAGPQGGPGRPPDAGDGT